jgi:hemoglobin-like flavoprotein
MLDLIVNSLGPDLEPVADELVELGRRHRLRGIPASYLPLMGRAFLDGMGQLLRKQYTEEDRAAWREIFEFISSHMAAGMAAST